MGSDPIIAYFMYVYYSRIFTVCAVFLKDSIMRTVRHLSSWIKYFLTSLGVLFLELLQSKHSFSGIKNYINVAADKNHNQIVHNMSHPDRSRGNTFSPQSEDPWMSPLLFNW